MRCLIDLIHRFKHKIYTFQLCSFTPYFTEFMVYVMQSFRSLNLLLYFKPVILNVRCMPHWRAILCSWGQSDFSSPVPKLLFTHVLIVSSSFKKWMLRIINMQNANNILKISYLVNLKNVLYLKFSKIKI